MARFSGLSVFALASALLATFAEADNHGVTFLYPGSTDISLNYLDTANVTYLSSFRSPKLYTFCSNASHPKVMQQKLIINVPAYNASQLVQLNWPDLSSCYFDLRPNSSAGYGANSFVVKVNSTARATPIIFGVNQPVAATSSSSPTATASLSPTPTPNNSSSGGTRGVDIGIGVGAAAIAFALGGLAFYFYRRRKAAKASRGSAIPDHDSQSGFEGQTKDQKRAWQQQSQEMGRDMQLQPVDIKPHEMPSPVPNTHLQSVHGHVHEMPAHTAHEMPADTGAHELNPEPSAARLVEVDDKSKKRFSWEGGAGARD